MKFLNKNLNLFLIFNYLRVSNAQKYDGHQAFNTSKLTALLIPFLLQALTSY